MPVISSDALVLRSYKIGETSRVVVFLTRDRGKVRAVAKGARGRRPRYRSALEPLSEVHIGLHGRQGAELLRLGECELLRSAFPRTGRADLSASLFLSYLAELLDAFSPEGQAEDAVYRLAVAAIRAVEAPVSNETLARYVEAWLLRLHGLYPPLDQCAGCGRPLGPGRLVYHTAAHGFVCENCGPASGPVLSLEARGYLGEIFRRSPGEMTQAVPNEAGVLETFHQDLITRHLERALRSQRVIKDVAREMKT
jgi:DNA repair protein RecO (recombination protein O)